MKKCRKCSVDLDSHRIHLGYSECVDCSSVKKYVSHTIYPHKTGSFVQPVSEEQSQNLNRLDRRGVGGTKVAKGIVADKSWDRYLKQLENPKPKKKKVKLTPKPMIHIPIKQALKTIIDNYDTAGYDSACALTQSLYADDKITLMGKSKIMGELASLQMMSVKQRKWMKKL